MFRNTLAVVATAGLFLLVIGSSSAAGQSATLSIKSTGPGAIAVEPAGDPRGCSTSNGYCRFSYPVGTRVHLTATAIGKGASLATWRGPCAAAGNAAVCAVDMNASKGALARFSPIRLIVRPRSGGRVDVGPGATACGFACWTFPYGSRVALTARPDEGRWFRSWEGLCKGYGQTCDAPMFEPSQTTAYFGCTAGDEECVDQDQGPLSKPMKIKVTIVGTGSVTIRSVNLNNKAFTKSCSAACRIEVPRSQMVVIEAKGRFRRWDGACRGASSRCAFSAIEDPSNTLPSVSASFR
ncbi:MAG: hypothetical protein AVDCRST_MAG67-357 [uncultured Solirubrobacteraceae bacterium]|uniref:Bacterial repeat domain-containing protein n=1 Tax=uncultured Solirubrobacteraceae bacterium TaxID=1162706 RepID=A0A6J4RJL6_9ACTN|nr:MAG: hypothetical protein AVDCRST_MAG67-357 [uncultured Solirubrobacteraceae bacterium]